MLEAGHRPHDGVDLDLGDLGSRSIDHFDWVGNSPWHQACHDASWWLSDRIKQSPNDNAQELPSNVDWRTLKGNQHKVFLQVIAYMKFIKDNPGRRPAPLFINVDGTAGTGKSWLIWSITKAVWELFPDQQNDLVA
jgi:hypothetical protein